MAMRMKDSGIEAKGEIAQQRTKFLFRIVNGATPSSSVEEYWNGEVSWITPSDMSKCNNGIVDQSERQISRAGFDSCGTSLVPTGSIVLSTRAPIGTVCMAGVELCTNQGCKSLVAIKDVNTKYYYYYFSIVGDSLNSLGRGTTFLELSSNDLGSFSLPFPEKNHQDIVVDFLDSRCAEIDAVIAAKQRQNELLKEQRQSIIFEAVTKGLDPTVTYKDSGVEWIGEIPEGWNAFKIKHIVAVPVTDGPHESPQLVDEGIPFISAEAVKGNKLDFSLMRGYISKEDHEVYCKKVRPQREDIFVVKSGATTGAIAIVDTDEEFSIWSPLAMVRSKKPEYIQRFVYYAMLSDSFRKQIELGWNFGTQQNLGMNVLENLYIACPLSTSVQQQIADYLDIRCAELDRVVSANNAVIDKLKEYRQSLIYEAVTGKIAV